MAFDNARHRKAFKSNITAKQQILCSSVSGSLGIFVGFPFDTVRVRLQTADEGTYRGVFDCAKRIVRDEGLMKLYGGLMAPLSVAAVRQTVIFGSNRIITKKLEQTPLSPTNKLLLAGVLTGVCNSVVVTPSDQLKIQVQSGRSNSIFTSFKDLYRKAGVFNGLYRGWRASVIRESLYYGAYFISFEYWRKCISYINPFDPHTARPNIFHPAIMFNTLLAGGLAGCTSWMVNLPADFVKSRLQGDSIERPRYKGVIHCAKSTYLNNGRKLSVFYTGLTPTLVRAFPVHATILLSYEILKQWISNQ
ncbi:solute carrier family 25 member [Acrasis kona]|uniref:Solute carrier family 25 member n=1 Tax=Acrasis kona TaxID=1008807 RepID=A0AAW2ZK00_9EUKA